MFFSSWKHSSSYSISFRAEYLLPRHFNAKTKCNLNEPLNSSICSKFLNFRYWKLWSLWYPLGIQILHILKPFCHIINCFLGARICLDSFKLSLVKPVKKKVIWMSYQIINQNAHLLHLQKFSRKFLQIEFSSFFRSF